MTPSRQGRPIVEGLAGATRAMVAGEFDAAEEMLAAVDAACAAAEAAGERLNASDLAEARTLQGQLETMAQQNQASLMASLLQSARARTANHAYKTDPDAAPALSLCMIVRDEAELLPRFLQQAQGLWDELVVVDTGSRDDTLPLLRQAGAHVIERPWTGDFAAARNAGLELARGQWILFLDADEMVSPELVTQIRALIADREAGAATLQMHNLLPHGNHRQSGLLRLFRNDPHIRFRHRIHEEVGTAVQAFLRGTGLQLRHLPGTVLHLGYVRERAQARNKKQRDSELLWRSVREDAGDFYSWFKLMELARFWNDAPLGQQAAEGCLAALEQAGPKALAGQAFGGELLVLIAGGLHRDDPERSLALLGRWEPGLEPSAAFHLRAGELAELRRRPDEAARRFQRCLELADRTADIQLATVRPLMGLARLALSRPGGLDLAWDFTRQALAFNPRDREALLAALAICQTAGGPGLLDKFLAEHRQRHGDSDELEEARREVLGLRV